MRFKGGFDRWSATCVQLLSGCGDDALGSEKLIGQSTVFCEQNGALPRFISLQAPIILYRRVSIYSGT